MTDRVQKILTAGLVYTLKLDTGRSPNNNCHFNMQMFQSQLKSRYFLLGTAPWRATFVQVKILKISEVTKFFFFFLIYFALAAQTLVIALFSYLREENGQKIVFNWSFVSHWFIKVLRQNMKETSDNNKSRLNMCIFVLANLWDVMLLVLVWCHIMYAEQELQIFHVFFMLLLLLLVSFFAWISLVFAAIDAVCMYVFGYLCDDFLNKHKRLIIEESEAGFFGRLIFFFVLRPLVSPKKMKN